jgi:hypothetical protein
MIAEIAITIMAALGAWLGWKKKVREGLIVALLLAAIVSLLAAFSIALPIDVGGYWMFAVSFVVLAGVSLVSLGVARWTRRFLGPT